MDLGSHLDVFEKSIFYSTYCGTNAPYWLKWGIATVLFSELSWRQVRLNY